MMKMSLLFVVALLVSPLGACNQAASLSAAPAPPTCYQMAQAGDFKTFRAYALCLNASENAASAGPLFQDLIVQMQAYRLEIADEEDARQITPDQADALLSQKQSALLSEAAQRQALLSPPAAPAATPPACIPTIGVSAATAFLAGYTHRAC